MPMSYSLHLLLLPLFLFPSTFTYPSLFSSNAHVVFSPSLPPSLHHLSIYIHLSFILFYQCPCCILSISSTFPCSSFRLHSPILHSFLPMPMSYSLHLFHLPLFIFPSTFTYSSFFSTNAHVVFSPSLPPSLVHLSIYFHLSFILFYQCPCRILSISSTFPCSSFHLL